MDSIRLRMSLCLFVACTLLCVVVGVGWKLHTFEHEEGIRDDRAVVQLTNIPVKTFWTPLFSCATHFRSINLAFVIQVAISPPMYTDAHARKRGGHNPP
jgi:heme/copper-type cytochrome/quinol oxidase subunit 4